MENPLAASRIRLFRTALVALLGISSLALTGCIGGGEDRTGGRAVNQLQVPDLLEAETTGGAKVFRLEAAAGQARFEEGETTDTYGYNGSYLGPTLRADRGDRVRIELKNRLPELTTLHWHGMHLPPEADGGPHQPVEPGAEWTPTWQIRQRASTLWYHPHPHGDTEDQVNRGLAGMFIVDDRHSRRSGLPDRYGIDDIPLIVQDRKFDGDGQFDHGGGGISPIGFLGDRILVNGTIDPYFEVTTSVVRLRLLNGSSARIYNFGFEDGRVFELVGTDGGLLPEPVPLERIRLSPGERAEVLVRFEPDETVRLQSLEQDLESGFFNERFDGSGDRFDVLEFRAGPRLARGGTEIELPARTRIEPSPDERRREIELSSASSINDESMDMDRIDLVASAGETELWRVENSHGVPHSFHVHDVQFEVLTLDGSSPPPELTGLKDTVLLLPGQVAELRMRMSEYVDEQLPYMFHCHLLRHEDRGMMGQFLVTEAGRIPDRAGAGGHDHQE